MQQSNTAGMLQNDAVYHMPKNPADPDIKVSSILTLFHMEGGGADSALLQIVFFITSVRDAAEPRNLVTFPNI